MRLPLPVCRDNVLVKVVTALIESLVTVSGSLLMVRGLMQVVLTVPGVMTGHAVARIPPGCGWLQVLGMIKCCPICLLGATIRLLLNCADCEFHKLRRSGFDTTIAQIRSHA